MKIVVTIAALLVSSGGSLALANQACPPVSVNASTNIWKNYVLNPNPFYRDHVLAAAEVIKDPTLKKQALKIADMGTFFWLDDNMALSKLRAVTDDVPCQNIVGIVLQGLTSGNCTLPSFRPVEFDTYQKAYVDPLASILRAKPTTVFAIIVEPDTLPAIIMNSTLSSCSGLASTYYRKNVAYALMALNLPNVVMYLDAGHGGTLGWELNLKPAAAELAAVYTAAGSPSQVRGIAVNIGGWNSWDASPGEFATTYESPRNYAQNERDFVKRLGNLLSKTGTPNHAIADTSRNGVYGLRREWTDWCNVNGAGFGRRPTADGTGLELADALVWAKGGGISDGTSNPASANYNPYCGKQDSFKPSPEKGEWNQAYFEMLLENAHPPIAVD
ncbi:1, 4-beta cellobiohydrolase [Apodospora peruviana]|uniref:Glucanase n=1 Tax=Apodospora peruviana TaxID=516989 RepID=A0AAE0MBX3_9PEZI|nr:1, 4-beta cellobiohydrolase [Apodospora peruviana]